MTEKIFTAPGRIEIGGNHTDHQRGRVLAAAVNLEVRGKFAESPEKLVRIDAEGFGATEVGLDVLNAQEPEKGTTAAIIRGVAEWFVKHGYKVGGFGGSVTSTVPAGAGLSSSAAFEVLVGRAFSVFFNGGRVSPLEVALAGQYAENVHFGKPCGLMDQCASSFGGLVAIDFKDAEQPEITPVNADFAGYAVCVVDTGGSHADLTSDYAAITAEMLGIANYFGKRRLREVDAEHFYAELPKLRQYGDRAVLRAIHFYEENERVAKQVDALKSGDLQSFFELVKESGRSSVSYLQNVFSPASPRDQGLTLALALTEKILDGKGAFRVHGGGFAGTILAFVPDSVYDGYKARMEDVFGGNACKRLTVKEMGE